MSQIGVWITTRNHAVNDITRRYLLFEARVSKPPLGPLSTCVVVVPFRESEKREAITAPCNLKEGLLPLSRTNQISAVYIVQVSSRFRGCTKQ